MKIKDTIIRNKNRNGQVIADYAQLRKQLLNWEAGCSTGATDETEAETG